MVDAFFKSIPIYKKKIKPTQIAPDLLHTAWIDIPKELEESLDGGMDSYTNVWCFKPEIHNKFMKYLQRLYPSSKLQEDCLYHFAKKYTPIDSYLIDNSICILLTVKDCIIEFIYLDIRLNL
jgi:hypothetical protein